MKLKYNYFRKIMCFIGLHQYLRSNFIKAEKYNPPQLFVAGCDVCTFCKKEKWL